MPGRLVTSLRSLMVVVGIITLALVIGAPGIAGAAKVRFADLSWDSAQVHNRIAGFILQHGYGHEVDYIPGETVPLVTGLQRGDLEVDMESWTENIQDLYDKGIKEGTMLDLGSNFPGSWQGWLVPTYIIKGDPARNIKASAPDLKSVSDLPKYWEVFKDPEDPKKGRFFSSIPGWKVTELNTKKFHAYGLDKTYNIFEPGSDAALKGSMIAAYEKGQAWLGYYWEPTDVLGKLDMTALEEPPYDKKIAETTAGCAFAPTQVNILINAKFAKANPDVTEFLKKYETTMKLNNQILAYMTDNKLEPKDAAKWFLKEKPDVWTAWVPADVAEKVKAALK